MGRRCHSPIRPFPLSESRSAYNMKSAFMWTLTIVAMAFAVATPGDFVESPAAVQDLLDTMVLDREQTHISPETELVESAYQQYDMASKAFRQAVLKQRTGRWSQLASDGTVDVPLRTELMSTEWYHRLGYALRIDYDKWICWPLSCTATKCGRNNHANDNRARAAYRKWKAMGCAPAMPAKKVKKAEKKKKKAKKKKRKKVSKVLNVVKKKPSTKKKAQKKKKKKVSKVLKVVKKKPSTKKKKQKMTRGKVKKSVGHNVKKAVE